MNKMHRKYDESLNAEFLKMVNTFRSVAEVSRDTAYIFYIFLFINSFLNY
jgi:hypothetical protein